MYLGHRHNYDFIRKNILETKKGVGVRSSLMLKQKKKKKKKEKEF